MVENAFYFMLKSLFDLETFTFLSCIFGYVEKRLDKKAKVNFKTTYILQCLISKGNQTIKLVMEKLVPEPFIKKIEYISG